MVVLIIFLFFNSQIGSLDHRQGLTTIGLKQSLKLCPSKRGIYYGSFPDFGGEEDTVSQERISDYEKYTGKEIVWAYFSNNWDEGIKFPKEQVEIIDQAGKIPFIRMMPWSKVEQDKRENRYRLDRIKDGQFDHQLIDWAKQAKDFNRPLLVDFAVEMNGEWFPWNGSWFGSDLQAAHLYRNAYRHIIKLFDDQKVRNITWFFHFNSQSWPKEDWNRAENYYPGDEYIDWLAVSAYGAQSKDDDEGLYLSDILDKNWSTAEAVSRNKPIALLEFGVIEDSKIRKTDWIEDAFKVIKSGKYPIKAISWWNEKWQNRDGTVSDLRVNSSKESLEVFKRMVSDQIFISQPFFCPN